MNYQAALQDFKSLLEELTLLSYGNEITYNDDRLNLEIRTTSMLIVRHYTDEIKTQGEIWGTHLVKIPKTASSNNYRLKSIISLIEKIIKDIESRINEGKSKDQLSLLVEQRNRAKTDLAIAENEKVKLQEEVQRLSLFANTSKAELLKFKEELKNALKTESNQISQQQVHNKLYNELANAQTKANRYLTFIKFFIFTFLTCAIIISYKLFNINFNLGIYLTIQILLIFILVYTSAKKLSEKTTFWLNFLAGLFLVILGVVLTKYI